MGAQTAIEWTDATWNPIGGCEIHTPGCIRCYAMRLAASWRLRSHPVYRGTTDEAKGNPVWNGTLTALPDDHHGWTWPISWRGAKAPKLGAGSRSLIFVGDMSDLFHARRATAHIDRAITAIVYSRHIGQLLTKRPDVMRLYFEELRESGRWREWRHPVTDALALLDTFEKVFSRIWCGASVERQQEADQRRDDLQALAHMGFTTFVSYEPALGAVDWTGWEFLRWLISGGESGPDARPSDPDWHRQARDWCKAHGIAYFFKQWGEWVPEREIRYHEGVTISGTHDWDAAECSFRIGKKRAGRKLDDVEHNGFPT